jgi:dTDP-4-dehydrorhamnose 3,5-epimerase
MIAGVAIKPLRLIPDQRGFLMEVLRDDDAAFERFGQCYISATYPGVVKAWHSHAVQTDNFCCVHGNLCVGLYDDREDSPTRGEVQKLVVGEQNRSLVQIPPGVWHGWVCLGSEMALVLNVPTEHYNHEAPDELRRPWDDPAIPFTWHVRGG